MLTYTLEGIRTAVVAMDDGKANALSITMIDALAGALARAESEANAMVLVGRPERFCAGFDLRVMMSGPDNARDMLTRGSGLLMKLFATPLPLVIACTGHALAAGALVVLTGDHRIGTAGAYKLGMNEVAIGMPVPILAMELLRARLTTTELTRATLLAQIYAPDEALAAGYLDAVVPADQVLERAKQSAAKLGGLSRMAYRETKKRLRGATIELITTTLADDMRSLTMPSAR